MIHPKRLGCSIRGMFYPQHNPQPLMMRVMRALYSFPLTLQCHYSNFRQWDDLAQAAGELAAALEVARKGTARRPGGGPDGWNLPWVQLCSSVPTLRKAWRTARAMRALVDTTC